MHNSNSYITNSDNLCPDILQKISNFTQKIPIEIPTRFFNPDEITECGRKIVFKTYQTHKTISNSENYANKYVKEKWADILNNTQGIRIIDKNVIVADCNYNIQSSVDFVASLTEHNGLDIIIYIKSLPTINFETKGNIYSRKDIVRVMIDLWLIEMNNGFIIYENRNTLDCHIYRIIPSLAIINAVKSKCLSLFSNCSHGTVPNRPYKDSSTKECQMCEFLKKCWE